MATKKTKTAHITTKHSKIILIGDGAVGSSYAYALTLLGVGRELGIIDMNVEKAKGDAMDLADALSFTSPKKIYAATYEDCADAGLVVIAAGAAQKPGETRLDLVDKNLRIFHDMISQVMASGFDGIFLVATNPVDVLTYATWRFSGLPSSRVLGSGTALDSARLRQELAELLDVDARNVHAYIMGEHGDSEFPVWSHANVGGMALSEWIMRNPETSSAALKEAFENVQQAAYRIIEAKGATYYGIGAALARITRAILSDENSILAVSGYMNGEYGFDDLYIGTPAIVGADGIKQVVGIPLEMTEHEAMRASAKLLKDTIEKSFAKLEEDLGVKIPEGKVE
ncbi:L-lactate dehydrogenase [Arcanobacterium pluranimalium]|uniref:L-lactate dehydrogenase n=1 Tax=Arcanobacterium pluranimalium TaxID=108028 RepID=UPI00308469BE|nr:L-lactate dehydrogenase [Arcanobacterium pluranimalium]